MTNEFFVAGSIPQISPVSSPASMSQSLSSPTTPATPFVPNPRTPKSVAPRSVGPRSVANVSDRELIPPSPLHPPPSVEQPRSVQPTRTTFVASETPNKSGTSTDSSSPLRGLKRPLLEPLLDEDDTGSRFSFSPNPALEDVDWTLLEPSAKALKTFHPAYEVDNAPPTPETAATPQIPPEVKAATPKPPDSSPSIIRAPGLDGEVATKEKTILNFVPNFPGTIGPLELARMFPTPPSMESQPACSPLDVHQQREWDESTYPVPESSSTGAGLAVIFSLHSSKYSPVELRHTGGTLSPPLPAYRPPWSLQPKFQHIPKLTNHFSNARIRNHSGGNNSGMTKNFTDQ